MFRALMKKELREHFPVAALGLALGLVAVVLHLQPPSQLGGHYTGASVWRFALQGSLRGSETLELPTPIAHGAYLGKLALLCYAVGGGLGFLMSCKEDFRKTWSFLLHRPVKPSVVLLAKLAAGTTLYLVATVVPFLLLCWWSSVPRHYYAPWAPELMYPGLDLIARGCLIFLGAFLSGAREARWYGTRLAPLAGAASFMWPIGGSWLWLEVLAFLLVGTALVLCAIWHVFLGVRKLRIALMLLNAIGITGALYAVSLVPSAIIRQSTRGLEWTQPQLSTEGEPQLVVHRPGIGRCTLKTLDGAVIAEHVKHSDPRVSRVASLTGKRSPWRWPERWRPGTRRPPVGYVSMWADAGWPALFVLWKENRLVSHDWDSCRAVGFWGRNGLATDRESAAPFPPIVRVTRAIGERAGAAYVVSDGGLFCVDEEKEEVTQFLDTPGYSFSRSFYGVKDGSEAIIYVRGPRSITVCGPHGEEPRRFRLPERIDEATSVGAILVDDETLGIVVDAKALEETSVEDWREKAYLLKLSRNGSVLWEREVLLSDPGSRSSTLEVFQALAPGASPLIWATDAVDDAIKGKEASWKHQRWPLMLGKAIVCGIVALLMLRGRGMKSTRFGWGLFAFMCGIGGVLAVWAELLSEKRVPCPSCGRQRLPSMLECSHCQAEWPAPERKDTDLLPAEA